MLELPFDCLLQIMLMSAPMDVIQFIQYTAKAWHEAANSSTIWKDISVKTLQNKSFQGFLMSHGRHMKKLRVTSLRLSRNATFQLRFHCTKLLELDLTSCYSDSLVDEKFCFLIRKIKLTSLLLIWAFNISAACHNFSLCKCEVIIWQLIFLVSKKWRH